MPDYDFRSLSSTDFQNLCRDLLQDEIGVRFETFAATLDRGIDARHRTTILQAKHYANSDLAALLRTMERDELPKIQQLRPTRYILATSVSLTVPGKEKLLALLAPYCRTGGDVLGREDLNNLLGRHPAVERRNFKLWLTSTEVLRRVLHAGIWDDTALTVERVRRKTSQFVPNASFSRAIDILEQHHYCIIAGIQGIGKTTLAEILMLEYLDHREFDVFRISESLSELKTVRDPDRKQLFYFDDFLGKTTLDKLERNEDQRLIEFMEDVKRNPKWRFLMTTREYILSKARMRYEALANPNVELRKCVVDLRDYTRKIRAEILYNHLYFSDFSDEHKHALLQKSAYKAIIDHKNYSPRIIEHITKRDIADAHPSAEYEAYVISVLDDPQLLWAHAFDHQISDAARDFLLVMMTLPGEAALTDAATAFASFHCAMHQRLGFRLTSTDFRDALRELDGNFIKTDRWGTDLLISFHNPSVQDFLEHRLVEEQDDVCTLVEAAVFFEQLVHLWRREAEFDAPSLRNNVTAIASSLQRLFDSPTCDVYRSTINGQPHRIEHVSVSSERRIRFARELAATKEREYDVVVHFLFEQLQARLRDGKGDREQLADLLSEIRDDAELQDEQAAVLRLAKPLLTDDFYSLDEVEALTRVIELFPGVVEEKEIAIARKNFLAFCSEEVLNMHGERDIDTLRDAADRLHIAGNSLGLDVSSRVADLWSAADEIEEERERERELERDREPPARWAPIEATGSDDAVIDAMFTSLRDELHANAE